MGASLTHEEMRRRLKDPTLPQHKRTYYLRVVNGLCARCDHPPLPESRMCSLCAMENAARAGIFRDRRSGGELPECDVRRGLLLSGYEREGGRWGVRLDAETARRVLKMVQRRLSRQSSANAGAQSE